MVATPPPPGPVTAWKSTLCMCSLSAAFFSETSTVSPTRTRTIGPGTLPLKVQNLKLAPRSGGDRADLPRGGGAGGGGRGQVGGQTDGVGDGGSRSIRRGANGGG